MSDKTICPMSAAVKSAYRKGEEDETLGPLVLTDRGKKPLGRISKGDSVIFYNIRGEREIELTESLTKKGFKDFAIAGALDLDFTTMIQYRSGLDVNIAFPPEAAVADTLSETLSRRHLRQVKITEAEKAVHVSFFLNGKRDEPFPGEEKLIVPTRKDVVLFDEAPEMSIDNITKTAVDKIKDRRFDFVFVNYPNVDVVGHIENEAAVISAVEAVDRNIGVAVEEALRNTMSVVITADHGTVEKWLYPDGAVDTGHTDSPVPFILVDPSSRISLKKHGELADVAPTVLQLFGIDAPGTMEGCSLIEGTYKRAAKTRDPLSSVGRMGLQRQ